MASVQWQKQTMQMAAALKKHNGQQERAELNHANPDIDKSRSGDNFFVGCSDYDEAYKKMKARVEEVDREYPPIRKQKERKVCCSLYTPCPLEIQAQGNEAVHSFFEKIHALYENFFGAENVHGSTVHLDEQHDYIDSKTGEDRTSLFHSTTLISCYSEWTEKRKGEEVERKGINGKHFETRGRLDALNKAVCAMVRSDFGVEYNTGEQTKSKANVEGLKGVSRQKKEQLAKEIDWLQEEKGIEQTQLKEVQDAVDELDRKVCDLQDEFHSKKKELQGLEQDIAALSSRKQDIERATQAAKDELTAAKETNRTSMVNLLSNIEPKPKPPDKPRRASWDVWERGYHPKDSKGRELTGHKLKKELEEEKKRYDEYMQPWIEYDRLYAEWEQRYKPLEEVTKAVEQYTKGNRAVKERENEVSEREKTVSEKAKNIESEIEQRAQALTEKRMQEMFSGAPTAREKRLEAFCDKVRFNDVSSVLDAFIEQEETLKKGKFRGR